VQPRSAGARGREQWPRARFADVTAITNPRKCPLDAGNVNAAGTLSIDRWNGQERAQFRLMDMAVPDAMVR
jgi:hypothetical protein